ncbi:MAG: AraC family transcriptional regulator, partial [Verrucomicrobiales bacterium]|nr:AraC family transcriptional regulator [Verrucomicrobiales bacterium]
GMRIKGMRIKGMRIKGMRIKGMRIKGMRINLRSSSRPANRECQGRHAYLPDHVWHRMADRPLFAGLRIPNAGLFSRAAGHYVERVNGSYADEFIFCTAGRGWVSFGDGRRQAVRPGTLIWLPARRRHAYGTGSDQRMAWTIEWVHVAGPEAAEWAALLGFPAGGGLRHFDFRRAAGLSLGGVYEYLEHGGAPADLAAAGAALRMALADFARQYAGAARPGGNSALERVAATVRLLRQHPQQTPRLAELARRAGLSVPHYRTVFRQLTGGAPVDWLNRQRILRACRLLETEDAPVSAVAEQTGFEDAGYFTRMFRKVTGETPLAYRRRRSGDDEGRRLLPSAAEDERYRRRLAPMAASAITCQKVT